MENVETKSILWIEDDYLALKALVTPLESEGFTIEGATTLCEAKASLEDPSKNYHLFIVDLLIGKGDCYIECDSDPLGIKVIQDIRKGRFKDCPVIVLSVIGNDQEIKDELEELNIERNHILAKGILRPSELRAMVIECISKDQMSKVIDRR